MRPAEDIEKFIKTYEVDSRTEMNDIIQKELLEAHKKSTEATPVRSGPVIWRIVMNTRGMKTIAALIVIALGFLWTFDWLDQGAPSAYAVDQSINAYHSVRSLHVKAYDGKEMIENRQCSDVWMQFDDSGRLSSYRMDITEPNKGPRSIVWEQHLTKTWMPDKNTLLLEKDSEENSQRASVLQGLVVEFDPRQVLQGLKHLQNEIELVIHEPNRPGDPIVLEVTGFSRDMGVPENTRMKFIVNAETKLLERFIRFHDSAGKLEPVQEFEFLSYNEPLESSVFELSDIPENAKVIDRTKPNEDYRPEDWGMAKGDKSDPEIAVAVVRKYIEALIDGDSTKAQKLTGGFYTVSFADSVLNSKVGRIVSIGQPRPHEKRKQILVVPCQLDIENQTSGKQTIHLNVRTKALKNHPERWIVCSQ